MNSKHCIEQLKNKFLPKGRKFEIKNLRGKIFSAEMCDEGIIVSNLGSEPLLPWKAFEEAINAMLALGGTAPKGNAMNSKYGDRDLGFDSIEGRVANVVYGKEEGDSVFRRITPIASILIWSGLCEKLPSALRLNSIAYFDEGSFKKHYNYFLALESDVNEVFRFIEPDSENFDTYSIQLAHLLLSISSEIDVVLKLLCKEIDRDSGAENIHEYRKIITRKYDGISYEIVYLYRFDLAFTPWQDWASNKIPAWWTSYNKVKHHRDTHFKDANLKNVLNAICGLYTALFYLRRAEIDQVLGIVDAKPIDLFRPDPLLLRLDGSHYMFRSAHSRLG